MKKSKNTEQDKDFLSSIRKEILELDRELNLKSGNNELEFSSDSEKTVKSSQELSSEFSISESWRESPKLEKKASNILKSRVSLPDFKKAPMGKSLADKERIKELEKRVKELENRVSEDKKRNTRLQEINDSLIKKVKELEGSKANVRKKGKNKEFKQENQRLVKEVQELKQNLRDSQKIIEVINKSYDTLVESSRSFEEKTRNLVDINDRLKSHLMLLLKPMKDINV